MTATTLAELVGVTKVTVSQYENGGFSPSPATLERIADVLNLPIEFFCRPSAPQSMEPVFWRSMSAATKAARTRATRRLGWLIEIVSFLRHYVDTPPVNYPTLPVPANPFDLHAETIEACAASARRHWKLGDGPISNVVWLLENNGTIVTRSELDARTLDAFSKWNVADGTPYVILGADKGAAARSRFDAAHEVAHMLLHRHLPPTRLGKAAEFHLIENQAHRFAGAFLLPAATFSADISAMGGVSLDALRVLKPKWGASIQLMLRRAEDLKLLTEDDASSLWRNLARRGWRTLEPLDDKLPIEEPRVLHRAFDLLLVEGLGSKAGIRSMMPITPTDIEDVTGLPRGYLADLPPNVQLLQPRRTPTSLPPSKSRPARRGSAKITRLFGNT